MVDACVKANRDFQHGHYDNLIQKCKIPAERDRLEQVQKGLRAEATRQVLLWNDTRCVHSVRQLAATESNKKGEWQARVWNSARVLKEVELSEKYAKFLLTPHAFFKKECFRLDTFVRLQDYDRQQTVDAGTHEYITKLLHYDFIMTDMSGKTVRVSRSWVFDKVDRESWRELSRKEYGPGC